MFKPVLIALLVGLLAACASTREPDANYSAYLRVVEQREAQEAQRFATLSASAAACKDDRCVETVTAMAALASVAGNRSGAAIAPFQRQRSAAEAVTLGVLSALPGLGQVWATVEAGRNSVEVARIGAEREIGIAQAWSGTALGIADAFSQLPPTVQVGRDYITGSQHVGDTVGRDQIGGDQHVGDEIGGSVIGGDNIGRDAIGRDRIDNAGNLGDRNRIGSPGPFDNDTDNGDRCTGDNCQGLPPPPDPEPDPEG